MRRASGGFTLLEVLVALVVVATALSAGFSAVSQAATTTDRLYDRLLGYWSATNARTELAVGARRIDAERGNWDVTMLGRGYRVTVDRPQPTSADFVDQVDHWRIEVAAAQAPLDVVAAVRLWD